MNNLQAAVLSSALAFVAGIVAVGFVWLAPNAAPPAVTVNLMIRPPAPSPGAPAAVPVAVCGVLPSPQPTGSTSIAIVPASSATAPGRTHDLRRHCTKLLAAGCVAGSSVDIR